MLTEKYIDFSKLVVYQIAVTAAVRNAPQLHQRETPLGHLGRVTCRCAAVICEKYVPLFEKQYPWLALITPEQMRQTEPFACYSIHIYWDLPWEEQLDHMPMDHRAIGLHRMAAVNVVSKECTAEHYAGMEPEAIMEKLQPETDGLTIITRGGEEMLYARKGGPLRRMKPFPVTVRSTLGAGDTFKAGCVYGLLHGMEDDDLVRFASACSGIAISRFPLPLKPPKLEEVQELIVSACI